MPAEARSEGRQDRLTRIVFLIGLLLSVWLWSRSQVAGDQLNLLARGWLLTAEGQWVPYGLPTSAGGKAPGAFTSLLVGLPLAIWPHHRAPTLVILGCHLIVYLLLDRMLHRNLGSTARLLFAVVYWLNPWRLYHASFLWNPNYLLPLGGLSLWLFYRQKDRPRLFESFLLLASIGLAAQVHASVAALAIVAMLLWWRGYFRLHWGGVILALAMVGVFLIPWAQAVLQDPSLLPQGAATNGRLAQSLHSASRGLGYWLRYAALVASSTMLCIDWPSLSSRLEAESVRHLLQAVVGMLTVPVVLWSNVRLWIGSRGWWRRVTTGLDFHSWLVGTVRWSFLGALLACAVSPTAVMSWQLLTVLHLAVMPLVLAGLDLARAGQTRLVLRGASMWTVLSLALTLIIGLGSPMFRCGGETCGAMNADPPPLRSRHEMLDALGIQRTCAYELDVPFGWWPDVLPEHQSAGSGPD